MQGSNVTDRLKELLALPLAKPVAPPEPTDTVGSKEDRELVRQLMLLERRVRRATEERRGL